MLICPVWQICNNNPVVNDLVNGHPWYQEQALAGSRDFTSAKIPGFFGIYCHYVLDPLERSYAKNRQNWQKYFSLFIRINPVPKNPGIPGFGKIPSRKIPGLKILIPLEPGIDYGDQVLCGVTEDVCTLDSLQILDPHWFKICHWWYFIFSTQGEQPSLSFVKFFSAFFFSSTSRGITIKSCIQVLSSFNWKQVWMKNINT